MSRAIYQALGVLAVLCRAIACGPCGAGFQPAHLGGRRDACTTIGTAAGRKALCGATCDCPAVLCFLAAVGVAAAASIAPALARGPTHAHAIGWAAVLLGVAFLCGATRSAWNGYMDLDNPHVCRPAVRFTAAADPGPFAGYLLLFYAFGIAAVVFGVYRLRQ